MLTRRRPTCSIPSGISDRFEVAAARSTIAAQSTEPARLQRRKGEAVVDRILEGKVALVTGAGTGLGRGIAEQLARAGADIAVAEINPESAETAASELAALGVRAQAYPADVSKSDRVDALFAAAPRELGRLDIVVNNAGVSHVGPTAAETYGRGLGRLGGSHAVRRLLLLARSGPASAAPGRRQRRQHLVDPRVLAQSRPYAYCAPKAAVLMMTSVAAGEWAGIGVRVNAIAPGIQRTPMWDHDVARGAIDEPVLPRPCRRAARRSAGRSAGSRSTSARTMRPTSRAAASRSTAGSRRSRRADGATHPTRRTRAPVPGSTTPATPSRTSSARSSSTAGCSDSRSSRNRRRKGATSARSSATPMRT